MKDDTSFSFSAPTYYGMLTNPNVKTIAGNQFEYCGKKMGEYEYPEEAKEVGLSVFEMENNLPALPNLMLINTLHSRIKQGYKAYIVTGNKIAEGNDGEPLLSNATIIEEYPYNQNKMFKYIISILMEKYQNHSGEYCDDKDSIFFGTFYTEEKRNIKTGEVISIYEDSGKAEYEILPPYTKVCCNGIDFWNPIDEFETGLGYKMEIYRKKIELLDYFQQGNELITPVNHHRHKS